jgi:hypothetical protein
VLQLLARRERNETSAWSPFASNDGDCDAVAQALLTAIEHEDCPVAELTPTRYAELRRRRPHIGLPRTTTVTAVCGSWHRAVEAAERRASALARRAAFA